MAEYILQRAWKFTMEAPGTWEQEEKPLIPPSRRGGESLTSSVLGSRNWLTKSIQLTAVWLFCPLVLRGELHP